MKALAVLVAAVIVSAIVVSNLGYGPRVFAFVDSIPGGDLTGHFVLYGLLGFAANAAAPGRARVAVTSALAAIVVLEEVSQAFIPARTFSLADLAASLAGLACGAAAAALLARRRPAAAQSSNAAS